MIMGQQRPESRGFTKCLKAVANERRVRILQLLLRSPRMRVGDVASAIRLSMKSTSKHLLKLAECDLVEREQVSLDVIYRVNRQHPLIQSILKHLIPK